MIDGSRPNWQKVYITASENNLLEYFYERNTQEFQVYFLIHSLTRNFVENYVFLDFNICVESFPKHKMNDKYLKKTHYSYLDALLLQPSDAFEAIQQRRGQTSCVVPFLKLMSSDFCSLGSSLLVTVQRPRLEKFWMCVKKRSECLNFSLIWISYSKEHLDIISIGVLPIWLYEVWCQTKSYFLAFFFKLFIMLYERKNKFHLEIKFNKIWFQNKLK